MTTKAFFVDPFLTIGIVCIKSFSPDCVKTNYLSCPLKDQSRNSDLSSFHFPNARLLGYMHITATQLHTIYFTNFGIIMKFFSFINDTSGIN